MRTNRLLYAVVLAGTLFAFGAVAQTDQPDLTTAAPGVPALIPDQVIYQAQLPDPSELAKTLTAHGIAIERITQTSNQVSLVYRTADRHIHLVVYLLLPGATASNTPATVPATIIQPPGAVVPPAASPTVVYTASAPDVVYGYDPFYGLFYDPFYYPWGWPGYVSFGFGLGYYNFGYGYSHFSAPRGVYHYRGGYHAGAVRGAPDYRNFVGHGVYQHSAGSSTWHNR